MAVFLGAFIADNVVLAMVAMIVSSVVFTVSVADDDDAAFDSGEVVITLNL